MNNLNLKRGDILKLNHSPQAGREQKGWRPAIVISPYEYNAISNTALLCPVTSNIQPWAWKVIIPEEEIITGAVLVDQCANRDYRACGAELCGSLSAIVIDEIIALLKTLTS